MSRIVFSVCSTIWHARRRTLSLLLVACIVSPTFACDQRDSLTGSNARAIAAAPDAAAAPSVLDSDRASKVATMNAVPGVDGRSPQPSAPPPPSAAETEPFISTGPLKAVASVELKRYMGRWYEIARYPNYFQDGVVGVIASYELTDKGEIRVTNTGREDTLDGDETEAKAKGWVVEGSGGAKWQVQFIWPFKADYWIIDVCPEYSFAVVGQPSREHLWILSRTPTMADGVYDGICRRLRANGYDPAKLKRTPQPAP